MENLLLKDRLSNFFLGCVKFLCLSGKKSTTIYWSYIQIKFLKGFQQLYIKTEREGQHVHNPTDFLHEVLAPLQ